MYLRFTSSKNSTHPTLQIVEGYREGKKVKQKIIASFGVIKNEQDKKRLATFAKNFIQKLEQEDFPLEKRLSASDLIHKKTVYDGFSLVTDHLMQLSGFSEILKNSQGKQSFNLNKIVNLIISQRLDLPSSKLRTFERQNEHGFQDIELQHIYRTMDALEPLNEAIQQQALNTVCAYSEQPVDCFFFDVTTLSFESVVQDDLKDFGYSKDQKFHQVQIVLAIVVNSEGIPIAYKIFKGNLSETKTLIPVLEELRNRFNIKNVTVICDRGMASEANINALKKSGFHFVIASKLKSISKKIKINDLSAYVLLPNQKNIPEEERVLFRTMPHPQYEDTTLIVTYSPNRREKDKKDRERLIEKLKEKLFNSPNKTSVKNVISNSGYKKYTNVKEGSLLTLNEEAIKEDEAWDGFHGIAVSNSANLSAPHALSRYHDLWHVEEAFRVAKSTLKARPIFHWTSHRIESHVLLCFMTLFLERLLEMLLKKASLALTPDKIRHALSSIHTVIFEDKSSNKKGKMESSISEDAKKIFSTLNISTQRSVSIA